MSLHSRTNFGSELSIEDIKLASGPPDGVSFDGTVVKICESLCSDGADNKFEPILVTYWVSGNFGLEIPRTAIFSLSTSTDTPPISSSLDHHPIMENGAICFDLSSDLEPHSRRLF